MENSYYAVEAVRPIFETIIHTLYHKVGQDTPVNQPVRRLKGAAALTHRKSPVYFTESAE